MGDHFLEGFLSELVKLGAFVQDPPKAAPTVPSTPNQLPAALGRLGAAVNRPSREKTPKADLRPPKPPS